MTPKYVLACQQAKALNIPLYENRTKFYRELNKAGYFWERDTEQWEFHAPDPPAPKEPEREHGVILQNDAGGIWFRGKDNDYQIANFGLRLVSHIRDSRNQILWQMAILHDGDQQTCITLTHEDFSTHGRFHAALLKYGFVFRGGNWELNHLKESLIPQAQEAERIERLGYHAESGTFAFSNGLFNHKFTPPDAFHIVKVGDKAFYLDYDAGLKQHEAFTRIVYIERKVTFDQVAKVAAGVYGKDGLLPLAYYIACLWRDLAFDHNHYFPLFCLYGRNPNTGKSTLARCLTAMFGYEQHTLSLISRSTLKSHLRSLDQQVNAVLWFDELPENLDNEVGKMLQAAYDGGGYNRAEISMDNATSMIYIKSGAVLTGNYLPQDEVLLSRWCVTVLNKQQHTDAQKAAYQKLNTLIREGLSSVTGQLLRSSELIRKGWTAKYEQTLARLRKLVKERHADVSERLINNMAVILTPAILLEQANKIHLRKAFGIADDLETFGFEAVAKQMPLLKGKSPLTVFWEVLAIGRERGEILEGRDFIITQGKRSKHAYLALRMARCMNFFSKEHRQLYGKIAPHKDEIESLITSHPAFLERKPVKFYEFDPTGKKECVVKNTPCLLFDRIEDEFGGVWA